jgi:hypothetical protein
VITDLDTRHPLPNGFDLCPNESRFEQPPSNELTIPPPSCPRMTGNVPCNRTASEHHYVRQSSRTHLWVLPTPCVLIGMADTCIQNMYANLTSARWFDLDVLHGQGLACLPCDSCFASDSLLYRSINLYHSKLLNEGGGI